MQTRSISHREITMKSRDLDSYLIVFPMHTHTHIPISKPRDSGFFHCPSCIHKLFIYKNRAPIFVRVHALIINKSLACLRAKWHQHLGRHARTSLQTIGQISPFISHIVFAKRVHFSNFGRFMFIELRNKRTNSFYASARFHFALVPHGGKRSSYNTYLTLRWFINVRSDMDTDAYVMDISIGGVGARRLDAYHRRGAILMNMRKPCATREYLISSRTVCELRMRVVWGCRKRLIFIIKSEFGFRQ